MVRSVLHSANFLTCVLLPKPILNAFSFVSCKKKKNNIFKVSFVGKNRENKCHCDDL